MKYLDKYPDCKGCPVVLYCGTMVSSIRLCNSYNDSAILNTAFDKVMNEQPKLQF